MTNDKNGLGTISFKLETTFLGEELPKLFLTILRSEWWIPLQWFFESSSFKVLINHKNDPKWKLFRLLTGQLFFPKTLCLKDFWKKLAFLFCRPNLQQAIWWNNNKILGQKYLLSCFVPFLPKAYRLAKYRSALQYIYIYIYIYIYSATGLKPTPSVHSLLSAIEPPTKFSKKGGLIESQF